MGKALRVVLLFVMPAVLGTATTPASGGGGGRPNILVIVTDDQRAGGTVGVMEQTRQWFANGGTRFTNAFATTPLCCPSRSSIFTGRYAHNHGVRTNPDAAELDHTSTIQRYLQEAGYETAIVGKFLNGWNVGVDPPFFDRWAISEPIQYYNSKFNVDGTIRTIERYSTDYVARRAARLIRDFEAHDGRPWFLYVAPYAPHVPLTVEPDYVDAPVPEWDGNPATAEQDRSDKPGYVQSGDATVDDGRTLHDGQLRLLMSADDLVGKVFEVLGEEGERRDTLAFYVSDNGYLWGEHGLIGKNAPYTQSIGIPLFMRWPDHVEAGRIDRRLVGNIDIFRTIMKSGGIRPDQDRPIDGRSLLNAARRDRILTEAWAQGVWASTRTATYHFIEYYNEDGAVTFREYYDLLADPWQLDNLLRDGDPSNNPDVVSLSAQLAADRNCVGAADCP